jgi:hypothetical protein
VALTRPEKFTLGMLVEKGYGSATGLRDLWVNLPTAIGTCQTPESLSWVLRNPRVPVTERFWWSGPSLGQNGPFEFLGTLRRLHTPLAIPEVVLDGCHLSTIQLGCMLATLNGLRRFTCRWNLNTRSTPSLWVGWPKDLLGLASIAISKHGDTLETLVLVIEKFADAQDYPISMPGIGSLRQLTALKILDVSGSVISSKRGLGLAVDWNLADFDTILPGSLEHFTVRTGGSLRTVATSLRKYKANCTAPCPAIHIVIPRIIDSLGFHTGTA